MVMPVLLGEVVVVHGLEEQQHGGLLLGNIGSIALVEQMARKAKGRGQSSVPPWAVWPACTVDTNMLCT